MMWCFSDVVESHGGNQTFLNNTNKASYNCENHLYYLEVVWMNSNFLTFCADVQVWPKVKSRKFTLRK